MPSNPVDRLLRPLRSLRISVTDRCNLRCAYCMPEENYVWLAREDILSFEEISRLADSFLALGVNKLRLTGGEPLLRRGLPDLVHHLAEKPGVEDLAMTTNAIRLAEHAVALRDAGLHRLTISLDTLHPERFRELTRTDGHARVLAGIEAALAANFRGTKIDMVVIRGFNDDELVPILEFGRERGIEVRFIEYMDVPGARKWKSEDVLSRDEILERVADALGPVEPRVSPASDAEHAAPANRYLLADGTIFGIVASTSTPFCAQCDRSRLTADGTWFLCLHALKGIALRPPLRRGATREEITRLIGTRWSARAERGAEINFTRHQTGSSLSPDGDERDPLVEMHTRGG
jgi:GTP 3',8-cyclase